MKIEMQSSPQERPYQSANGYVMVLAGVALIVMGALMIMRGAGLPGLGGIVVPAVHVDNDR